MSDQVVEIDGEMLLEGEGGVKGAGANFINRGVLDVIGNGGLSGSGSFANSGVIVKLAGGGESRFELSLLSSGGTIDVRSGSLNPAGNVSITSSMSKSGTGVLTVTGPQSHSVNSTLGVGQGTLNLNTDAGASGARNLTVGVSPGGPGYTALANFNGPQHLVGVNAILGREVVLKEGGQASLDVDALNQ